MVASKQVDIPCYKGAGQQRGRGFGALEQVIGRTTIPILRKNVVPAAKRVNADLMAFALPEIPEVGCGRRSFNSATKGVGKEKLRKHLGSGCNQRRVIPTKATKQAKGSHRGIFT